jgi:hypothetical protein
VTRVPPAAAVAAALGLAVLAPGAAAQDPATLLEGIPQVAANPPASVISDRYREIETVVTEALPAVGAAKPAAAPLAPPEPPAVPEPEYHAEAKQYHSESPSQVTVTQANPSNVNVSIRINSPGDDGPVTQVNATGPVSAAPPGPAQPQAAERPPSSAEPPPAGPDSWEWIWTSACFGDRTPMAAASATWVWRWSCGEPAIAEGVGEIGDEVGTMLEQAGELAAVPSLPALAEELAPSGRERRPAPRARRESRRSGEAAGPAAYERPPPPLTAANGVLETASASPPVTPAAVDPALPARPKAQARPRDDTGSLTPSGDGGLAAGPATGLGGAPSLLLAGWIAVLVSALGLVLPRLWMRRWSGPAWRIPWPRTTRLERPG